MREPFNEMPLPELFAALNPPDVLEALITAAQREDMGEAGDVTSAVTIDPKRRGEAVIRNRSEGVICGQPLLPMIGKAYGAGLNVRGSCEDGQRRNAGACVSAIDGLMVDILAAERVMLNFLCHLSGIATLTARFVDAVEGTGAKIYDTRKTIPGLRGLAKYAVRCGGGCCHRIGLYDAVLIKDNHLFGYEGAALRRHLEGVVKRARQEEAGFVEVEVDTLEQLEQVLACDVDIVLLDNMGPDALRRAVAMRDDAAAGVQLEASGGVDLDSVRAIAEAGVDRIAIGALTHSAPVLDLGLDVTAEYE